MPATKAFESRSESAPAIAAAEAAGSPEGNAVGGFKASVTTVKHAEQEEGEDEEPDLELGAARGVWASAT
jgi:hypothetical protein